MMTTRVTSRRMRDPMSWKLPFGGASLELSACPGAAIRPSLPEGQVDVYQVSRFQGRGPTDSERTAAWTHDPRCATVRALRNEGPIPSQGRPFAHSEVVMRRCLAYAIAFCAT